MGIPRVSGFAFNLRQTSKPSMSGIMTSSKMRSGFSAPVAIAKAFSPLVATLVLYESLSRPSITSTFVGVSSTIRMSFRSELDIFAFKVELKAEKVGSIFELYNNPIATFGATIPQSASKVFDEIDAEAAWLKLIQRLIDRLCWRPCHVEGAAIIFNCHRCAVWKSLDSDRNEQGIHRFYLRWRRLTVLHNIRHKFFKTNLHRKGARLRQRQLDSYRFDPTRRKRNLRNCSLEKAMPTALG